MHPTAMNAQAPVDCVQGGHAAALLRFERSVMSESQNETTNAYVPGRTRPSDCTSGRESEADGRCAAGTDGQAVQCYQREMTCDTDADKIISLSLPNPEF